MKLNFLKIGTNCLAIMLVAFLATACSKSSSSSSDSTSSKTEKTDSIADENKADENSDAIQAQEETPSFQNLLVEQKKLTYQGVTFRYVEDDMEGQDPIVFEEKIKLMLLPGNKMNIETDGQDIIVDYGTYTVDGLKLTLNPKGKASITGEFNEDFTELILNIPSTIDGKQSPTTTLTVRV